MGLRDINIDLGTGMVTGTYRRTATATNVKY